MEYAKLETLTIHTFDKNDVKALEFIKKLCNDETIKARFQGLLVGLLNNKNNDFFNHGFLVSYNDTYIGYINIGEFNNEEKYVYLRADIDKDIRGAKYGQRLLSEITEYIFINYPQVESIRLKIASDNKPSLKVADSCGFVLAGYEIYAKNNPYISNKIKNY
ncbi:MAG: GNAT family N-acetyltransferase [Bacilli bacterium]|nr:GNAT family N-acetyltransferase [Bacilli bacterium]